MVRTCTIGIVKTGTVLLKTVRCERFRTKIQPYKKRISHNHKVILIFFAVVSEDAGFRESLRLVIVWR